MATKKKSKKSSTSPTAAAPKPTVKPKPDGKLSVLDAAVRVLKQSREPMNCQQMVEKMLSQKLWSTSGKTPAATLSSAIQREIADRGKESRFQKTARGQFSLA